MPQTTDMGSTAVDVTTDSTTQWTPLKIIFVIAATSSVLTVACLLQQSYLLIKVLQSVINIM